MKVKGRRWYNKHGKSKAPRVCEETTTIGDLRPKKAIIYVSSRCFPYRVDRKGFNNK